MAKTGSSSLVDDLRAGLTSETNVAKWIFHAAGIYGILVLAPQYLMETGAVGEFPAIARPEQFYGFIGVALVWQLVFLFIARDVLRYRPLMPLAVLEKAVLVCRWRSCTPPAAWPATS